MVDKNKLLIFVSTKTHEAMKRIFFLLLSILALSSCASRVTVVTEYGDTVAVHAEQADTLTPGTAVTLYTASFDHYLIGRDRAASGVRTINGENAYVLQGIIK